MLAPWNKSYDQPRQHLKSRDITLPTKVYLVKAMVFLVVMYGCESWTKRKLSAEELILLNCGVGEDSWKSSDCKEIQPVHPKENQSWIFIERTDAKTETETAILWLPDAKNWLSGKDPDAGKDWGQEKETTEDEMAGWHHRLNGHEFEWTPGVGDGQGGLACCSSWGCKESDTTEQLNWTDLGAVDTPEKSQTRALTLRNFDSMWKRQWIKNKQIRFFFQIAISAKRK